MYRPDRWLRPYVVVPLLLLLICGCVPIPVSSTDWFTDPEFTWVLHEDDLQMMIYLYTVFPGPWHPRSVTPGFPNGWTQEED